MHKVATFEEKRRDDPRGRRRKLSNAYIVDRILYVCRTGCQWSQLHVENSSFKTVYHHFNRWSKARVFEDAFYETVKASRPRGDSLVLDTSFVKNVYGKEVVGRNPTDRGRLATKVSLLTDSEGTPLCTVFHKANKNDSKTLRHLLETTNRKTKALCNYKDILADKGYDSAECRATCGAYGLNALIPRRRTKEYYKGRYVIEQKHLRSIPTHKGAL